MDMRPAVFLLLSLVLLWVGMLLGVRIREKRDEIIEHESKIITVLEGSLLTLFGLLIGFTFSMAVSRYDVRKQLVLTEANAIGTTWLRTALLTGPTRSEEQSLLRQYVQQRLRYVSAGHDRTEVEDSLKRASDLQAHMWAAASDYATEHRDVTTSLFLSTLNDSIDVSEERTAANENRIPAEAWWMLLFVGFVATLLVGLDVRPRSWVLQATLPIVLAGALALTMDMDSPRYGLIRITQPSMERVAQQMMNSLPQQAP
jgi:hypothetical protein